MNKEEEIDIVSEVEKHFAFLQTNGYQVQPIVHTGSMDCWEIQIESHNTDVLFKLLSDRGQLFLLIANRKENFWISLSVVLFFITGTAVLRSSEKAGGTGEQLRFLAVLLDEYIEQIMKIFGKNSMQYKEKFIEIRQKLRTVEVNEIRNKSRH